MEREQNQLFSSTGTNMPDMDFQDREQALGHPRDLLAEEKTSTAANLLGDAYDWASNHKAEIGISIGLATAAGLAGAFRTGLFGSSKAAASDAFGERTVAAIKEGRSITRSGVGEDFAVPVLNPAAAGSRAGVNFELRDSFILRTVDRPPAPWDRHMIISDIDPWRLGVRDGNPRLLESLNRASATERNRGKVVPVPEMDSWRLGTREGNPRLFERITRESLNRAAYEKEKRFVRELDSSRLISN